MVYSIPGFDSMPTLNHFGDNMNQSDGLFLSALHYPDKQDSPKLQHNSGKF